MASLVVFFFSVFLYLRAPFFCSVLLYLKGEFFMWRVKLEVYWNKGLYETNCVRA